MSLCAICDKTNLTARLCGACRRDPANDGWDEGDEERVEAGDDLAASERTVLIPLAMAIDEQPVRDLTPLGQAIMKLVPLSRDIVQTYRDPRRYWLVTRRLRVPLAHREIARLVGCHHRTVARVILAQVHRMLGD